MVAVRSEPAHCSTGDHLVQVYRDPVDLAEAVAVFFDAGLKAGGAAIAVAVPAHWEAIAERLEARGHDVTRLEADGKLVVADADEILSRISTGGEPDPDLFREVVGALLDQAGGDNGPRARAFGEMVDILCRRGEREAAHTLEGYWNQLAREREFVLLCGYKVDIFDRDVQINLLPQVYRTHSDVLPIFEVNALDDAVARALAEVLGDDAANKVRIQVERNGGDARLSVGQRTLMWVSAHMPRAAEQILNSARREYLVAVESAAA
jgi:hypothetical protein